MTNDADNPSADIAFMRQLAEEGATAPLRGGSILMAAGLIYGAASFLHWAGVSGRIALEDESLGLMWMGATLVFLAVILIAAFRRRAGGVRTVANRAAAVAWTAVGWGIFSTFASVAVVAARMGQDGLLFLALTPSVVMVLYGMGWAVSATMMRSGQLWSLAIGSFVAAPLLAAFAGQDVQYLAYGACLFLLMAAPGFALMRRAQRG